MEQIIKKIFDSKIADISKTGNTYWVFNSLRAKPNMIHLFCEKNEYPKVCFLESNRKSITNLTNIEYYNNFYSVDGINWQPISDLVSKVIGNGYAFVFCKIELLDNADFLYLDNYSHFFDNTKPLTLKSGMYTQCAEYKKMNDSTKEMKTQERKIIAVGELCKPYSVWIK